MDRFKKGLRRVKAVGAAVLGWVVGVPHTDGDEQLAERVGVRRRGRRETKVDHGPPPEGPLSQPFDRPWKES